MIPLLEMRWRDGVFAHWPVDPETVSRTLPEGLSIATHDGRAWLGVVGFEMTGIRPRGVPRTLGRSFPELNLRTYVDRGDERGVYFYNLDADDRLSVGLARRLFRLPYYRARMSLDPGVETRLRSRRVHPGVPPARFDGRYRLRSDPEEAARGSRAAFFVENYRFFTSDDRGRLWRGTIAHPPWAVAPAELTVRRNDLFEASGFDSPGGEPVVHGFRSIDVRAGPIRRV
ncbi:MAG: DUF2071 domain-containing protein [Halalkalicoccus sp.]